MLWGPALLLASEDRTLENLRAFAKLYGYVKYFHPSDEASSVDWKRLAIHGAARVKTAKDAAELELRLKELFGPLGPTLQIYGAAEQPGEVLERFPKQTSGLAVVARQHHGDGLDSAKGPENAHHSYRMHQPRSSSKPDIGQITQAVSAAGCKGKQIRLRARMRLQNASVAGCTRCILEAIVLLDSRR
jgi:hypothetical protein